MTRQQLETINDFFVRTFNTILLYEERSLSEKGFPDLSVKEVHIISAAARLEGSGCNTMSQIAAAQGITAGALSTAVSALIRKGYLSRASSPRDRRIVLIHPTAKGREVNERHDEFHRAMISHLVNVIPDENDLERLTESLGCLSDFFSKL